MAPSKSRLPDSDDTSQADTPMTNVNDDAANHVHAGNADDSMVVCTYDISDSVDPGVAQALP